MLTIKNLLKILAAQVLTIAIVLAFIETGGQIYARLHPSYETLSMIPDPIVGWKLAPNLKYIYTGGHWYAREFSVDIEHNALGFRDFNWNNIKPINTKRIALLGDSSVAAKEVEFRKTPGQILQQLLDNHRKNNKKYEVPWNIKLRIWNDGKLLIKLANTLGKIFHASQNDVRNIRI